jgi:predicted DNA-binding protein with PD1-like motif
MRYSEAAQGRVFIIRLEGGEVIHEALEQFCREHKVAAAAVIIVGAAGKGSNLVVGPEDQDAHPIVPMHFLLNNAHEVCGTGTIFPDERGEPSLHMHIAAGREGKASAGCVRSGVKIWLMAEVILFELVGTSARRRMDPGSGFEILSP